MPLLDLPNELLLRIAWFVLKCPTCHCHHISHHLSVLARCTRGLHTALAPELLRTASALHMLLWGISQSRPDTVTLAIKLGATLNIPLRETHHLARSTAHVYLGTPVDIAIRTHTRSSHASHHTLDIITLLLRAGGNQPIASLHILAASGDVALLARCLPYITDINARTSTTNRTLLEAAGANGHVAIVTLLLAAGASVNSTGAPGSPHYYPPLWTICDAPVAVLQCLLDAGADARWEHAGVSVVEHLVRTYVDVDCNADLLARHGARVPRGEEAIGLWQAPVWEVWTGGVVVEVEDVVGRVSTVDRVQVHHDYHGFDLVVDGSWDGWGPMCEVAVADRGCMCPVCPVWRTRGQRVVRVVVGESRGGGRYDRTE